MGCCRVILFKFDSCLYVNASTNPQVLTTFLTIQPALSVLRGTRRRAHAHTHTCSRLSAVPTPQNFSNYTCFPSLCPRAASRGDADHFQPLRGGRLKYLRFFVPRTRNDIFQGQFTSNFPQLGGPAMQELSYFHHSLNYRQEITR